MPKETFLNLPEIKRNKIIDAALREFEKYGFDAASINRIVDGSGIAKGSFYQYFEQKKDLFKYVISLTVEKKIEFITPVMMNPDRHDFFTLMRELFESGLRFAAANPRLVRIGNRFMSDKSHPVYTEVLQENIGKSYDIYKMLLEKAIVRGEVRGGIDTALVAYLLSALSIEIVEYYRETVADDWDVKMMQTVNKLLDFIQHGIGTKPKEVQRNGKG